ncbi:MAG: benzoyl-CoA 2,3-epoxidase subunit BoxA [Polyangiaceae bacterium]|nr:benzoyl-CoA 2,3-epoxidase subunit BoxA [Polyangiaceae bacterium]
MSEASAPLRQHLIDPEICIRCNTCESVCKPKAISHDSRNYVVAFDLCNACGDCLSPCPTGAIDNWRRVEKPFTIAEQFLWDSLPGDAEPPTEVGPADVPPDVARLVAEANRAQGGEVPPPWSAAHPYVNLYTPSKTAIATIAGNHRLTAETSDVDIRHIVLDFGRTAFPVLEGQSIGILPPGNDENGRPHHVRLYSVASPRNGERPGYNNLALTVKRITVDHDGNPVRGVASNYLCDLNKGDKVQCTGPYGTSFLMPNNPGSKLLMICTGTGAAPMRAMTERRRRRLALNEGGEILLFFGARRKSELPYFGPLMKLPRSLIDVQLAFSREPDQAKEYVQDRMRVRADAVVNFLRDENAFVYICGHKRMEEGVLHAFEDICKERGLNWHLIFASMRSEGRFHIETY